MSVLAPLTRMAVRENNGHPSAAIFSSLLERDELNPNRKGIELNRWRGSGSGELA